MSLNKVSFSFIFYNTSCVEGGYLALVGIYREEQIQVNTDMIAPSLRRASFARVLLLLVLQSAQGQCLVSGGGSGSFAFCSSSLHRRSACRRPINAASLQSLSKDNANAGIIESDNLVDDEDDEASDAGIAQQRYREARIVRPLQAMAAAGIVLSSSVAIPPSADAAFSFASSPSASSKTFEAALRKHFGTSVLPSAVASRRILTTLNQYNTKTKKVVLGSTLCGAGSGTGSGTKSGARGSDSRTLLKLPGGKRRLKEKTFGGQLEVGLGGSSLGGGSSSSGNKSAGAEKGTNFRLTSVAGVPIASTVSQLFSQTPYNGRAIVAYGPTISLSSSGQVGQRVRGYVGRTGLGSCGPSVAVLDELKSRNRGGSAVKNSILKAMVSGPEEDVFTKLRQRLADAGVDVKSKDTDVLMAAVAQQLMKIATDAVMNEVDATIAKPNFWDDVSEVVLIGGIVIDGSGDGEGEYFLPVKFQTIGKGFDVADDGSGRTATSLPFVKTNLMDNLYDAKYDKLSLAENKKSSSGANTGSLQLPKLSLPKVELPSIPMPGMKVAVPKVPTVPDIKVPDIGNIKLKDAIVGAGVATTGVAVAQKILNRKREDESIADFAILEEEPPKKEERKPFFALPNFFGKKEDDIPPPVPAAVTEQKKKSFFSSLPNPFADKEDDSISVESTALPTADEEGKKSIFPSISLPNPLDSIRNGVIAKSFRSGTLSSLTNDLLDLSFATNQGQDASSQEIEAALDIVAKLESIAPVPPRKLSSREMEGTWELEFCSQPYLFRTSPFFMARRSSCSSDPILRSYYEDDCMTFQKTVQSSGEIGAIRQIIKRGQMVSEIEFVTGWGNGKSALVSSAALRPSALTKVNGRSAGIWDVSLRGCEVKGKYPQLVRQLRENKAAMSGVIKAPPFATTYLDDNVRIGRDQDGAVYVFRKSSKNTKPTDYSSIARDTTKII